MSGSSAGAHVNDSTDIFNAVDNCAICTVAGLCSETYSQIIKAFGKSEQSFIGGSGSTCRNCLPATRRPRLALRSRRQQHFTTGAHWIGCRRTVSPELEFLDFQLDITPGQFDHRTLTRFGKIPAQTPLGACQTARVPTRAWGQAMNTATDRFVAIAFTPP